MSYKEREELRRASEHRQKIKKQKEDDKKLAKIQKEKNSRIGINHRKHKKNYET